MSEMAPPPQSSGSSQASFNPQASSTPRPKSASKEKLAKELKAERRAAKVAQRPDGKPGPPAASERPQSRGQPQSCTRPSTAEEGKRTAQQQKKPQQQPAVATAPEPQATTAVSLFGNVSRPRGSATQANSLISSTYKSAIHPSIFKLSIQLSEYKLMGADTRAMALLQALADVIREYKTPRGEILNRDLLKTVSAQVGYLVEARAMGTSTGVATRYLKYEISVCSADMTQDEAKDHLLERIDHFIRDRIVYAAKIIRAQAGSKIKDGDVVMTFARSSVVEGTLLAAHRQGIRFSVIVVDSRPLLEGRALLSVLLAADIPCTYGLITSLGTLMPRATLLLLGTASLLANGALYSRSGTAVCAMMASHKGIPVIVCCETYKFSERVQLDSFVQNEAGNPSDLLAERRGKTLGVGEVDGLKELSVVNLLYDVTPPRYVSAVASEVGLSGPESVGVILRDYKSVLYGV